jgi:hypothetical protein
MIKFLFVLLPLFSFGQSRDSAYWNHIKNEDRLKFIRSNQSRSGIVTAIVSEADGDVHVWIKARNGRKTVCEIICNKQTPICWGYDNNIKIPRLGQFIVVVGDYVYDRRHHWYEIHPVKFLHTFAQESYYEGNH